MTEADAGTGAIVDTHTGVLLRAVLVGPYPEELVVDRRAGLVFVANQGGTPTGLAIGDHDRTLFIAGAHGSITNVDASTGARRFQRVITPRPAAALRLLLAADDARGTLLAAHNARINALDPSTGRSIAAIPLPSTVMAVALDPVTGGAMVTVRGPVDARDRLLGDGSLLVFDARGRHLDTILAGVNPSSLAVDPGNGRVLVADTNLDPDGSLAPPRPAPTPPLTHFLSRLRSWLPFLPPVPPARSMISAVDVLRLDMR